MSIMRGTCQRLSCPELRSVIQMAISTEHVDAGNQCRPGRARHAQRRESPVAIDQQPVHSRIEQVRRDQREHDGCDPVQSLQVAPAGSIGDQERRAPDQDEEVRLQLRGDGGMKTQRRDGVCQQQAHGHDRHRQQGAKREAVEQPAMAVADVAGAIRLRHQRVESQQHAHPEDREGDVHGGADANGADRLGTERPHHQRVDHAHGHPAEFGHHHGDGEAEHRDQFRAKGGAHGNLQAYGRMGAGASHAKQSRSG